MPTVAPLIDYAAARKGLVQAVAAGTGLAPNRIIRLQGQGPVQAPPPRPYATFLFRMAAMRVNYRDSMVPAPEVSPSAYYLKGNRGIAVDLTFYADDQDAAYGLAANMQSALFADPILALLRAQNFVIWQIGDVTDTAALLGTGFEGRALLEFQMWTTTAKLVDPDQIDGLRIVGDFTGDVGLELTE